MIKNINKYDIYDMTDAELDLYIAENEVDFHENKRGRAYKRVQRRNHIEKRTKLMNEITTLSIKDNKYIKQFAKMHCGCRRAKCKVCHYSKIFNKPTIKEIKFNDKMRDELLEIGA